MINTPQNNDIMKKLLLLLTVTLFSLSSMAMGFPQNTYSQQRALNKSSKKIEIKTSLQKIEVGIKDTLANLKKEEESTQKSFVEMVVNYVVHFFAEKVFEQKTVSIKCFNKHELNCIAIKKDFEYYYLVG
jgi:hypothetical protein